MPQICDMGQTALLHLQRKACCGFFRPKNPTASAGFEPAILGTRGQHANHQTTETTPRLSSPICYTTNVTIKWGKGTWLCAATIRVHSHPDSWFGHTFISDYVRQPDTWQATWIYACSYKSSHYSKVYNLCRCMIVTKDNLRFVFEQRIHLSLESTSG
jgi:hypothetical protein